MPRVHRNWVLAPLVLALLAGCSCGKSAEEESGVGGGGGGAGNATGGGGGASTNVYGAAGGAGGGGAATSGEDGKGGPGSQAKKATTKHPLPVDGLEMRARLVEDDVRVGDAVIVNLQFVNRLRAPMALYDFERDLARRLMLRYRWGDQDYALSSGVPPVADDSPPTTTELLAGESASFEFDVLPLLRRTQGYGIGAIKFYLEYTGDVSIAPPGTRAWNTDPAHRLASRELKLDIVMPLWFETAGADAELYYQVDDSMLRWTAGAGNDPEVKQKIASLGKPGCAALAALGTRLEATGMTLDYRASNSLRMLRHMGQPALDVLRMAPPSPSVDMMRDMIASDLQDAQKTLPSAQAQLFRAIASGEGSGTTLALMFRGRGDERDLEVRLDEGGSIWTVRDPQSPKREAMRRAATTDEITTIKYAVLGAKPWTWRSMRGEARPKEGDVIFTLLRDGGPVWTTTLHGEEAVSGNPFAADVVKAVLRVIEEHKAVPDSMKTADEKHAPPEPTKPPK